MFTQGHIDKARLRSSAAWFLFGIGFGLVIAAWLVWTQLTGLSFWTSPNRALALRLRHELLSIALVISALAPMFCGFTLLRRLGLCALSTLAVGVTYFLLGLVWLAAYGV